jgi:carbamoyltransferase
MVGSDGGRYRSVIEEFQKLTGIGAVLNTSFNLHGEPIVATPTDALRTFETTRADVLAMGDFLVTREAGVGR